MRASKSLKAFDFGYHNLSLFSIVILLALVALLVTAGCSKSRQESSPAPKSPAATQGSPGSPTAATDSSAADTTARLAAIDWAVKQDEIKNDPNGQWAIQATASSTYNDAQGDAGWSANQATGAPNVENYGDDQRAWAPKTPDGGIEWLDLKYAKPVHATEVRVRESCASGAVVKVELFDEQAGAHLVWSGDDPTRELNYLMVKFPKTSFRTARVKVTLATNVVPGWNEIDAVQVVGTDQ